jgi:cell division GTPase FtsZ
MRLLILGLGTAGSRIADAIAGVNGRSARRTAVHTIAVDNDPEVLDNLKNIEREAKFYFPRDDITSPELLTTNFTIDEVKAKLRTYDTKTHGHDAILLCAGLGGVLIDLIPHLVEIIRETVFEPVFGLVTLPDDSEGEARLRKAALNMRKIRRLLDGVIVFDNQLWLNKYKEHEEAFAQQKNQGMSDRFWTSGNETQNTDHYDQINRQIARRIHHLIQAGEVQDTAPQMVLDTREILNTMTGMDLITLGMADEPLEERPRINLFRQKEESIVNRQERAGRIVKLAERAVFRDISAFCDLSSARKALILLAGPEEELSMKGFMAVRKWIDDSIDGFELRSGDSPISARYGASVTVLILLAGLGNVTRVEELDRLLPRKNQGDSVVVSGNP